MGCDDPLIPRAAAYCLACMRRGIAIVVFSDVEYDDAAASAESTLTVRPSMIGDRLPCSDNDVICTSARLARPISSLRCLWHDVLTLFHSVAPPLLIAPAAQP